RLAAGRSQLLTAESNYTTSRAIYRQVIGVEAGKLTAASPVDRLSPGTLGGALARGTTEHPTITTATYNVDAAVFQVKIAEIALYGVREEARVGQRTTLDVLNAQQDLVNARVALVTAQRDRVVASYTVLAAVGSLSPQILALRIEVYDPTVHYHQVRDSWAGVRTPDGR